jgi:D-serine deaminase-like pyridoxal phosphate-dependent protein
MIFQQIVQPTLLLDPHRCKANIRKMTQKAVAHGFQLRPHFKTHQSHIVGSWFRDEGIDKITVSSAGMASFFEMNGWGDITIAFPVNIRQIKELKELSQKVKLGLVVVDPDTVDVLGKQVPNEIYIWVKIDVGTHRTGIRPEDTGIIDAMMERIKSHPQLHFSGFLGHAGHSYQSRSAGEVERVHLNSVDMMNEIRKRYLNSFPDLKISLGDTPAASMISHFGRIDEFRPGNFVFYDLQQEELGSCTLDEIAVAMACPVVAVHPERLQWIIYGGGIHFAKDFLTLKDGRKCFGRWVKPEGNSWITSETIPGPFLLSLSQEHGVVQCTPQTFHLRKPGDLTLWLPVHSCMTADAMGGYLATDGARIDHYREHLWS